MPRWLVIVGVAFIGYTMFGDDVVGKVDPDAALPLFLKSDILRSGIKGLVSVGFVAAYMSTFSSEINASASIIVRDIYQPLTKSEDDTGSGHMMPIGAATSFLMTKAYTTFSSAVGRKVIPRAIWHGRNPT